MELIFSNQDYTQLKHELTTPIMAILETYIADIICHAPRYLCFSVPFRSNYLASAYLAEQVRKHHDCITIVGGSAIAWLAKEHLWNV